MNAIIEVKPQNPSNAMKHGILSGHLLLQSEDPSEYMALLEALQHEYVPETMTERHLVEELAGIVWRKRRLRIAEAAYHRKELEHKHDYSSHTAKAAMIYTHTKANIGKFNLKDAIASNDADNQEKLKELSQYRDPAIKVFAFLESKKPNYNKAMKMLAVVTREWWQEEKLGEEISPGKRYEPCVEHLHSFLLLEVLPYYNQQYEEIIHREKVKQQAEGEAFIPNDTQERFNRYEVHLDRKFERTLTVILRLQEMRKNKEDTLPQGKIA